MMQIMCTLYIQDTTHTPYLFLGRLPGLSPSSPEQGVQAHVAIEGGCADDSRVPGAPVALKDPL